MSKIEKTKEFRMIIKDKSKYYIYFYIGSSLKIKNLDINSSIDTIISTLRDLKLVNIPDDITTLIFNSDNEKWRTVSDYINQKYSNELRRNISINIKKCYEISNFGRVRRKLTNSYRYLNGTRSLFETNNKEKRYGYPAIYLQLDHPGEDDKDTFATQVHELVASCFLVKTDYNPDGTRIVGKHLINHKDHNKLNPIVENLEYCDAKYNSLH